mmetsp:Transcript_5381/g.11340  ORF Transcript_5381/g.11340 Transcript_5381/m.11340 type:complete len:274 (-) Transcript_5381:320-1141(-)
MCSRIAIQFPWNAQNDATEISPLSNDESLEGRHLFISFVISSTTPCSISFVRIIPHGSVAANVCVSYLSTSVDSRVEFVLRIIEPTAKTTASARSKESEWRLTACLSSPNASCSRQTTAGLKELVAADELVFVVENESHNFPISLLALVRTSSEFSSARIASTTRATPPSAQIWARCSISCSTSELRDRMHLSWSCSRFPLESERMVSKTTPASPLFSVAVVFGALSSPERWFGACHSVRRGDCITSEPAFELLSTMWSRAGAAEVLTVRFPG